MSSTGSSQPDNYYKYSVQYVVYSLNLLACYSVCKVVDPQSDDGLKRTLASDFLGTFVASMDGSWPD